ncbi:hypothetical protein [Nannocystis sp.]|uniref:hypothetical protein n=1 Tax=Nannocystis sp. TaxID=1962667 RepID=UPI0025E9E484|nr:hypothetical protein [Nannocystis sp.]MBK7829706.1 hypothetical protein [Nannocystis sp.]
MIFSTEAVYDTLSLVSHLTEPLEGVRQPEVHLFAYLACVLSLYDGKPVADWGYLFAGTANGSPLSPALDASIEQLEASGMLSVTDDLLTLSEIGKQEYGIQQGLSQNAWREAYLTGACDSVLALPVGVLRDALSRESALDRAAQLATTRALLEDSDLQTLYDQFGALSEAIGVQVKELMIPAVTWLSYLSRLPRREVVPSEVG